MKKRIGTKIYDTDKADLIKTLPDGVQIYRKSAGMREFFRYDPNAKAPRNMFRDLPSDQAVEYLPTEERDRRTTNVSPTVRFSAYDLDRIRKLATKNGMPVNRFLLMLVDEYERRMNI